MVTKQKAKGSAYERDVAKLLSELVGQTFERTPRSGAMTGGANRSRIDGKVPINASVFIGDIMPPLSSTIKVRIECKNYKELSGGFHALMNGKSKQIDKWIAQIRHDSDNGKDNHLLFFKISNQSQFVVMPQKYYSSMLEINKTFKIDKKEGGGLYRLPYLIYPYGKDDDFYYIIHHDYLFAMKADFLKCLHA